MKAEQNRAFYRRKALANIGDFITVKCKVCGKNVSYTFDGGVKRKYCDDCRKWQEHLVNKILNKKNYQKRKNAKKLQVA